MDKTDRDSVRERIHAILELSGREDWELILITAKGKKASVFGLSGLRTPSNRKAMFESTERSIIERCDLAIRFASKKLKGAAI